MHLLSPELPSRSRLLMGTVGNMRSTALLTGLSAIDEIKLRGNRGSSRGMRNGRMGVATQSARENTRKALEVPCRSLETRETISITKSDPGNREHTRSLRVGGAKKAGTRSRYG